MPKFRLDDYDFLEEMGDYGHGKKKKTKKKTKDMMNYEMDMNKTKTSKDDKAGASIKIGQRGKGAGTMVDSKPHGPSGKPHPKPEDESSMKYKGENNMRVISRYLQDAVGGDADDIAAADNAKVAPGKNPAHGTGNTSKNHITGTKDKVSTVEPNPQKGVKPGSPKLGMGSTQSGGNAKEVKGGNH